MSVTCENLGPRRRPLRTEQAPPRNITLAGYITTFILAALAIQLLMNHTMHWGKIKLDDLRYGRPRTMYLKAFVGHEETNGEPTHLIAMNLQRQVIVLEMPGGDPQKVRSFYGPYLFGNDEALTPVIIDVQDIDGDSQPDLLVNVRNEKIVYLNRNGTFRLPTPAEKTSLSEAQSP